MNFAEDARRKLTTSLDALLKERADSARQTLGALRSAVDQRIAEVATLLTDQDDRGWLEPVVEELSRAAQEQSDAAAAKARLESEDAARVQLVAAQTESQARQAESQARIDAERAENATLREARDQAQRQLESLQQEIAAIQQAHADTSAQLVDAQMNNAALADAIADVRGEMAKMRDDLQAREISLADAEARALALTGQSQQLQQALNEADARVARETHERTTLAATLEDTQKAASRAKAETLDRVRTALQAFATATSGTDVLETLVTQLGHEFTRAAIFFVRPTVLEGWRGIGLDSATTITSLGVPLTVDNPLTRALRDKKSVTVAQNADGNPAGLFGSSVASAIAIPILVSGHVFVVAYAEQAQERSGPDADSSCRIADILGDQVSRRLTAIAARAAAAAPRTAVASGSAAASPKPSPMPTPDDGPQYSGPARQARRIRLPEGTEVLVDGGVSVLVDLSSRGAQLLAPKAMRPNHTVRVMLPREQGALPCNGRIVWAVCEPSQGGGKVLYRAGVHFTDVDGPAVEAFLSGMVATGALSSRLTPQ